MAQRTWKRVLAGGALLAALTLATPPPAQAVPLSSESLWSWFFHLWAGPVPTAVSGHARALKPSGTEAWNKIGPGMDPNGCPGTQTTGESSCGANSSNIGVGINPNG